MVTVRNEYIWQNKFATLSLTDVSYETSDDINMLELHVCMENLYSPFNQHLSQDVMKSSTKEKILSKTLNKLELNNKNSILI